MRMRLCSSHLHLPFNPFRLVSTPQHHKGPMRILVRVLLIPRAIKQSGSELSFKQGELIESVRVRNHVQQCDRVNHPGGA